MSQPSYMITTPIYYVNGDPHLGHAYTTIACDVLARFKRLDGYDVHFLTGTDEHGIKVHQAARASGVQPQDFCDRIADKFRAVLPLLNISHDDFIRTTEARHKRGAQALWSALVAAGAIYKDSYAGWYAVRDEAYYAEDETEQRADGKRYALASGAECTWMEEESYFFKLSAWQDRLLAFYDAHPDFIQPEARRNEVLAFVRGGLKDLSISRTTFDWGVPVPDDPKHVMYVWIDALANYITALGYPDEQNDLWRFWPASLQMVGKEIIRFHCVYWPAFLMAAGIAPPHRVYAHGWWTAEGEKMSKSLGNVIAPDDLVARYGVDGARYVLLRDVPFGNDGDFSHAQAINRINNDLANNLGNLAQRTLSFIAKNAEGCVPPHGDLNAIDQALLNAARVDLLPRVRAALDRTRFDKALEAIMDVVTQANVYIDQQAPWTLKKTDPDRMGTVLYVLLEVIRCSALLMQPFVPASAGRLLDQLAVDPAKRSFEFMGHRLVGQTSLPPPSGVFPRLEAAQAA